jgi:cobalt-zinc-cadmium efflux system outer membrane protein
MTPSLRPFALLALLLGGCAAYDPTMPADVARAITERTGVDAGDQAELSDEDLARRIASLLAGGLTTESAVRIAVVNNPDLQAAYARLGIARGDLIEAGLFPNPVFDAEVHFRGGGIGTGSNLNLNEEIIGVLQVPLRKRLASASLEAAKDELVAKVLDVVADTKAAFIAAQAAEQTVELRRTILGAAQASAAIVARQKKAGNASPLAIATERVAYARVRRDLARAEAAAFDAREKLNRMLGLWGDQTRWTICGRLPEMPDGDIDPRGLEALAIEHRPELTQARAELEAAAVAVGITDAYRYLPEFQLGVDVEGEDGPRTLPGPNFSLPLPIFNQGQARKLQADSRFREAERRYRGTAVRVRSEVRAAYAKLRLARAEARYDRDTMIPAARALVGSAQAEYNSMLLGVFDLLRAKQEEVEAGGSYVEALRDYWLARAELERALGGRLSCGDRGAGDEVPQGTGPGLQHQHEG